MIYHLHFFIRLYQSHYSLLHLLPLFNDFLMFKCQVIDLKGSEGIKWLFRRRWGCLELWICTVVSKCCVLCEQRLVVISAFGFSSVLLCVCLDVLCDCFICSFRSFFSENYFLSGRLSISSPNSWLTFLFFVLRKQIIVTKTLRHILFLILCHENLIFSSNYSFFFYFVLLTFTQKFTWRNDLEDRL